MKLAQTLQMPQPCETSIQSVPALPALVGGVSDAMITPEAGGTLEMDYLNAKVTWRLNGEECRGKPAGQFIEKAVDFLGLRLALRFEPGHSLALPFDTGRSDPRVDITALSRSLEVEVQSSGVRRGVVQLNRANFLLRRTNQSQNVTTPVDLNQPIVELVFRFLKLDEQPINVKDLLQNGQHSVRDVARDLLSRSGLALQLDLDTEKSGRQKAEAEVESLGGELGREKSCRQEAEERTQAAEAEVSRLSALINAETEQAAERECHFVRSAVKIQSKWRQILIQQRFHRERAERAWRLKQTKFQPETPYDAILAFDSLEQFLKEGKIDLLMKAESQLEIAKESRYRIIAVVGLFDKGKTWLLNKLFGANLPAGKLCTTKGLSFLWFEKERMLVIDSAGVQSTVSYRAQAVDAIHDAQTTESLMFEMISRISHRIIFVVNDLTWFEQKYVAMLHQKYVHSKQNKELIVVHNLRNTSDVAEATKLFTRQVTLCYDGESSHLGDLIFTADMGEGVPPVHHVGLCYEFSTAGDAFNEKNRGHLLQCLVLGDKLGTHNALTDLLSRELSRLLPKFVNIEDTEPEASGAASSEKAISVTFKAADATAANPDGEGSCYTTSGTFRMLLAQENARVTTKTRGVISPLGEIIAHDVSFDPIVNVFDRTVDTGVQRDISIVCDGVSEDQIEWEVLANGLEVTIDKKPLIDELSVQPVEPIRQHHGVFKRKFLFDQTEGHFEFREEECKLENGVLTLVFKKALQPRKGGLGKARARRCERGQGMSYAPSDCSWEVAPSEVSVEAASGKLAMA